MQVEKLVRQVPRQDPRLSERADEWDKMTLETLRDQLAFTRGKHTHPQWMTYTNSGEVNI